MSFPTKRPSVSPTRARTVALGAADAGKAEVQVAAAKELADHVADEGPAKSVAFLVPLGIKLFELGKKPREDAVQW